jgi:hypothetical protein
MAAFDLFIHYCHESLCFPTNPTIMDVGRAGPAYYLDKTGIYRNCQHFGGGGGGGCCYLLTKQGYIWPFLLMNGS